MVQRRDMTQKVSFRIEKRTLSDHKSHRRLADQGNNRLKGLFGEHHDGET